MEYVPVIAVSDVVKLFIGELNNNNNNNNNNNKKYILKQPNIGEMCRRCGKEPEIIQHITAACE
jgi:hypothetical protein